MKYSRNSLEQLKEIDPTTVPNPVSGEVVRGVFNGLHWTRNSAGVIVYGQSALTNPITGTGTTNYIPNFTGTGSLGNSPISTDSKSITINALDDTGNRTNPFNSLIISTTNLSNPYYQFGGSILFKNTSYISGLKESSRIRSVVYDGGDNLGGGLAFDVTATTSSALTEAIRIHYNGNVLIGTTTDNGAKLQVNGSATFASSVTATSFIKSGGTSAQFLKADGSVDSTSYLTSLSGAVLTTTNQSIAGIKTFTNNTASTSTTTGTIVVTGGVGISGNINAGGTITGTDFIGSSDITLKENIQVLQPKKINSNYKTFNFIGSEQQRVGLVAQELEIEHPEFVRTDYNGIKSVSYTDLHNAEIAYLKDKIERLEELVNKLMK